MTDLQEQVLNDLTKKMSQEIDNEVFCELLQESGWTRCRARACHDHKKIYAWVQNNVQGSSRGFKYTWAFENAQDATAFLLVWA